MVSECPPKIQDLEFVSDVLFWNLKEIKLYKNVVIQKLNLHVNKVVNKYENLVRYFRILGVVCIEYVSVNINYSMVFQGNELLFQRANLNLWW